MSTSYTTIRKFKSLTAKSRSKKSQVSYKENIDTSATIIVAGKKVKLDTPNKIKAFAEIMIWAKNNELK